MSEELAAVDVMYLEGIAMKRAQLRREHADVREEEIDVLLTQWLHDRPLDSPGRIRAR
jgi:hypothetical protein